MPSALLEVLANNDLVITFNDTLKIVDIEDTDIIVKIYGPASSYHFSYTSVYQDSNTVYVTMDISSSLIGSNQEEVVIDWGDRDKFKSIYSLRGVNPSEISDHLFAYSGDDVSSEQLGQTAMIVFLTSVGIALISSFGGNSMEMMWNLMNTLQLLYFLSLVNVNYPEITLQFFDYLGYANANNEFMSEFTYIFVSKDNFKRGQVNDRLGDKAFFVNCSDKIVVMIILFFTFCFTFVFDLINLKGEGKVMKIFNKLLNFLKYNFFIRFGMEIFLEVIINALINMYWKDYSTGYEIMSFTVALFCIVTSVFLVIFSFVFLTIKRDKIAFAPDKLVHFAALFEEINHTDSYAIYYYVIFFARRIIFAFGLVSFYESAEPQILV